MVGGANLRLAPDDLARAAVTRAIQRAKGRVLQLEVPAAAA